jgi:hypothetical protein
VDSDFATTGKIYGIFHAMLVSSGMIVKKYIVLHNNFQKIIPGKGVGKNV